MTVQKFLEELSVEKLLNKFNFIIPEIQREYVWGENDHGILDKFFNDIKEAIKEGNTSETDQAQIKALEVMLEMADPKDKNNISDLMEKYLSKRDMNIGFLYSYRPDYYVFNDRNEDVYLIDGQQRFTTLFLALFYFALKEPNYLDDFLTLIRFDKQLEKIAFDYRVRNLTHNFLVELVSRSKTVHDLVDIQERTWFLTDFANDVTVKAMIRTIAKLHEQFKKDETSYYQFIKKQIRFWHFKTEETSQGEELYITMNSRGQQLADNETIRAKLFENENVRSQQTLWGAKWEKWQDFFWKNKEEDGNADNGLNQFLRWVNVIECFSTQGFSTKDKAEKTYRSLISENQVLDYVTLSEIDQCFNALEKLKLYSDEGYFSSSVFANNFDEEWLQGNISQLNLIKLLSSIMFLKANRPKEDLNRYIRFFSNITLESDVTKNPDSYIIDSILLTKSFLDNDLTDVADLIKFKDKFPRLLTSEEVYKLSIYKGQTNPTQRAKIEEEFWKAENFKPNKGKIGHLIQMSVFNKEIDSFSFVRPFDYSVLKPVNITTFKAVNFAYTEVVYNEDEIWGNLIDSEMYYESGDRIQVNGYWYHNNALLKMSLKRKKDQDVDMQNFIVGFEKKFVLNYNYEEISAETNPKKQLYLNYILHKRILKKWSWSNWNFGIYDGEEYPNLHSIFSYKLIFQSYNQNWRYNMGYDPRNGIWLQDNFNSKRDYIAELFTWANT